MRKIWCLACLLAAAAYWLFPKDSDVTYTGGSHGFELAAKVVSLVPFPRHGKKGR